MNKIRLLTISATCERGGSDINLLRLLKSLNKNKYKILHLIPYPGPLMDEFKNAAVQVEIVDMPRIRVFKNPLKYLTILLKFFPTVFNIKRIIVRNQIDLVCTSSMVNLYGALAARLADRPHILMAVEYLPILKPLSHYFFFLSEKIICCSNMVKQMFKKSDKVVVRYPGVDLNEFSPQVSGQNLRDELSLSTSLVSMVTRLDKWKGVETFIKAAKYLEQEVRFIIFAELVLGKEKYLNKLEKMIKQLRLEGKVFIKIARSTPELIVASDIIVHASLRPEPFGLIIIEAMAAGRLVIASNLGGPREIITKGIDGLLVEPDNPKVLAAAISDLLRNPQVARDMGLKARETVAKKFNLKEYAQGLDSIFHERIKEHFLRAAQASIGKKTLLKISLPLAKLLRLVPTKTREIEKDKIKRILVVQLFGMGDLICSLPLLEALKKYFNQSKITLLIDKKLSGLAKLSDSQDEIMDYERGLLSKFRLISNIRKRKFDLAVLLNPLFQGAWVSYLGGAKYRLGYVRDYEGIQNIEKLTSLLTHPILPRDKPMHDMQRYLDITKSVGIEIRDTTFELHIPEKAAKWVDTFLRDKAIKDNDFILGINPHAGWESKCWEASRFSEVAEVMIEKYNAKVIFFGSSTASDIARINLIKSLLKDKVIYAAGKTDIPELAILLKRCSVFLTNDSGPMHLAAALGIKIVALFGPTDVKKFGYEKENIINIAANNSLAKPSAFSDNIDTQGIEVQEVIRAIEILFFNKKCSGIK